MKALWANIQAIIKEPIAGNVDATDLILSTGVVIVAAVFWFFVLQHVRLAAEEIV